MKIYAVVSGCYSDFSINALFTKEEDAKKFCARMNYFGYGNDDDEDEYGILTYEADKPDEMNLDMPNKAHVHAEFLEQTNELTYCDVGEVYEHQKDKLVVQREDANLYNRFDNANDFESCINLDFNVNIRPNEDYKTLIKRSEKIAIDKYYGWKARNDT